MAERYGMVYMGSKEKILPLIKYIFEREYKKKTFIDLFCGGLSVSSYALHKTNFNVIANDLNKYVISLHKEIMKVGSLLHEVKYDWVSRKHFEDVRDNPQNFNDWYVGYVLNVWSFGCNQKDYLYAKDLEEYKRALHVAIVDKNYELMKQDDNLKHIIENYLTINPDILKLYDYRKNPTETRLFFMKNMKFHINDSKGTERQQVLERLEQMENLSQLEHMSSLNKNTKKQNRLELYNYDYKQMYDFVTQDINGYTPDNTFIYCDPPYQDTKKYQAGQNFDYDEFWQWFRETPFSVYVSSYKAPDDIKPINFELKQVNLDNGKKGERYAEKKKAVENIYWNGKGNAEPMMIDLLFNND